MLPSSDIWKQSTLIAELSHLGLLQIKGIGAKNLMQGQFTCDLNEISETQSRLCAHCNPQGRIISLFRLFYFDETYFLQMPKELVSIARLALNKYAAFYKAIRLEEVTDSFKQVGYVGTGLEKYLPDLPSSINEVMTYNQVTIIKVSEKPARYEVFYPQDSPISLPLINLPTSPLPWQHFDIIDGIPAIYPETTEQFLPHEINLPKLQGVSFKKGCYTGQEIIARMEYRGKLKKKLIGMSVNTPIPPNRGAEIFSQGKSCGNIVDYCLISYNNSYELLVIISESELSGILTLDKEEKYILTLML